MDKNNLTQQYNSRKVFRLHLGHRLSIGSLHINKCRKMLYCYFQSLCVSLFLNWYNSCQHSCFEFHTFAYKKPIEIHNQLKWCTRQMFFFIKEQPKIWVADQINPTQFQMDLYYIFQLNKNSSWLRCDCSKKKSSQE